MKTLVYAFHLPAFLFITGFFLPEKLVLMPPVEFSRKYIFPYARLYLFVTAVSVLIWWLGYIALRHHVISPVGAITKIYFTFYEKLFYDLTANRTI